MQLEITDVAGRLFGQEIGETSVKIEATIIWTVSTHQAGQVTSKERNTGKHRELQSDGGQHGPGLETPPQKPGPLLVTVTGLTEGPARAQDRKWVGRAVEAVEAPPGRTPARTDSESTHSAEAE